MRSFYQSLMVFSPFLIDDGFDDFDEMALMK